ncbi:MAG: potassium-transporting ATPase subunit KdpA [Caulobacteraceae bacterium]|nr:potassium-transporting ATPase subunit KdpA [Caulobacteraceae bacterium]
MTWQGWAEIAFVIGLTLALSWPLGIYIANVWRGKVRWLSALERVFYGASGVDGSKGQGWLVYAIGLLAVDAAGFFLLYGILRLQDHLPLNPQGFGPLSPHLAFNTAISFVTNTNWQSYGGEQTMSHLSQMAGLTVQNFVSAGVGMAAAAALARAFAANRGDTIGNVWSDIVRNVIYVLAPMSIVVALVLVALGVPQTLAAHADAITLEGAKQTIALGPVASQEAIKMLGTNGGGFFNANSAHPFENPTPFTNLIEMVAMNVIGFACVIAFGIVAGARKAAMALFGAMAILLSGAAASIYVAESQPTPAVHAVGASQTANMEGKEVRFGTAATAVFAAMTTGASCGAVNGMHESFTPLGGGVAMFMIQLGEMLPGGVGSGLYGIVVMAILAVFVAGLMVGRTPEYLGKKIEAREVKFAVLAVLVLPVVLLGFSAVALVLPIALQGQLSTGVHGLSEILYAYTSAVGNNGSAFAGLTANSWWWNTTLGIAMALGRFAYVVPVLAIAGAVAAKPKLAPTAGTLPVDNGLFVALLVGIILILGGLQYFPALALGPIVEHFQMLAAVAR